MKDIHRARMETELARAHRALHYALEAAERLESPGDVEDIAAIQREVIRVAEFSLRDRRRRGAAREPDLYA